ncbi:MAG: hypothetical protein Q4B03_02635 [Lachnospiraceae bacterium]|nr:hypothetical protein [Lachnospiraceae bacterium]
MGYFINRIIELITTYQFYLMVLGIPLGLGLCFSGYRYIQSWVAAFLFCVGMGGGYLVSSRLIADHPYAPPVIGLVCGVILMLFSFVIAKVGIFIFAAVLAAGVIQQLPVIQQTSTLNLPGSFGPALAERLPVLLAVLLACALGFAAVKLLRFAIIFVTAAAGAYWVVMCITSLNTGLQFTPETREVWIGIIVLLAILGMVVQNFTTPKEKDEKLKGKKL